VLRKGEVDDVYDWVWLGMVTGFILENIFRVSAKGYDIP
jgi:hypothetical protein